MKRITSANQLKVFLEAVAKEATIKARKKITEDMDSELEYFARGLQSNKRDQKSRYSKMASLVEVEEENEENPEDEAPAIPEDEAPEGTQEEVPEDIPEPSPEKAPNKAEIDIPLIEEEPDFEEIVKAIGWLRAGSSIKGEQKKQLEDYLAKLGLPEKKALYTMLSSMANVLHKEIPGAKGQDPEDPPLNLIIDDPKEEEEEIEKEQQPTDSDAPIKVGQSQSLNEMRKIVRRLMEKK